MFYIKTVFQIACANVFVVIAIHPLMRQANKDKQGSLSVLAHEVQSAGKQW